MLLKRLFLIAAIGILVMASCARRTIKFSDEVKVELMSDFHTQEEVRVTRIVNGEKVYSEIHAIDDHSHFGDEIDAIFDDVDFDLTDISLDFDDGLSLNLRGDGNGDVLDISAEFSEDDIGEITIETSR